MIYGPKCYQPNAALAGNAGEIPGWIDGAFYATVRYTPNGTDAAGDNNLGGNWVLGPSSSNQMVPDMDVHHNTFNGTEPTDCVDFGFFSAHLTVMNAVFADGSVHPISTKIQGLSKSQGGEDNCMLFRLGARDDGLQVDY